MLKRISTARAEYMERMSEDAKGMCMDAVYYISKGERCDNAWDVVQIIKEDLGNENAEDVYMDNQEAVLVVLVLDWMRSNGYDVVSDWQLDEIEDICAAYCGFYDTYIPHLLRNVEELALYKACAGNEMYAVDTRGVVINTATNKPLAPRDGGNGYLKVRLYGGEADGSNVAIHRLVARAFCDGFKQGLVVNHKNYDKHDNRAGNLEWCTQKYNCEHARARS